MQGQWALPAITGGGNDIDAGGQNLVAKIQRKYFQKGVDAMGESRDITRAPAIPSGLNGE
jgi:hypothetical protein